jgi:hypothetical protein
MASQNGASVPSDHVMCVQASSAAGPEVPTLGQFGLGLLLMSLLGAGIFRLRRQR